MSFTSGQLHDAISSCRRCLPVIPVRYWVAFSGGMDSHVLLHAISDMRDTLQAELHAVHVNHGLQAQAVDWAVHCRQTCQQLDIPLTIIDVNAAHERGQSPEAAARDARYAALAELLVEGDVLMTGQHARDQAETFLLQSLRGAGPRGLSAMPSMSTLGKGYLIRPLLSVSYENLEAYAEKQGLEWVDDPSNTDIGFDRNYLRRTVMPGLRERWPSLDATLSRVASQQAETELLLAEMAQQDSEGLIDRASSLDMPGVSALSLPRQRNVLRYWLSELGLALPSSRKLEQLQRDMFNAAEDRNPHIEWQGVEVRRYRGRLYAMRPLGEFDDNVRLDWKPGKPLVLPGEAGKLLSRPVQGGGVCLGVDEDLHAELRFRHGGESCRPQGKNHHTSLKKLFQQAGIPPWQRNRTPLLFVGDELAAIPGLCICEPYVAAAGKTGFELDWQPAITEAGELTGF